MHIQTLSILTGILLAAVTSALFMLRNLVQMKLKTAIAQVIIEAIAIAAAVALTLFFLPDYVISYWLVSVVFGLGGVIHVSMTHKKHFSQAGSNIVLGEVLLALSTLLAASALIVAFIYFLVSRHFLFFPFMMSGFVYLVPLVFNYTYKALLHIPDASFPTWQYPFDTSIYTSDEDDTNLNDLVIGFEIAKESGDKKTYFRAKTPPNMDLGELYYNFIEEYNERNEGKIKYADKEDNRYIWWFRTKPKWYQWSSVLDPARTITENKIKENTVIICERLNRSGYA